MVATIRQFVKVEPGGVVRVQSSELREGTVAEVVVRPDASPAEREPAHPLQAEALPPASTWASFSGSGVSMGRTVEEIDADIRELRDEWDR